MSAASTLEQQVEKQALEIVDRAGAGARTGTFTVTHLGPRFARAAIGLALTSREAERAYMRFVRACLNFERHRDAVANARLAVRAMQLEAVASKAQGPGFGPNDLAELKGKLQGYLEMIRQVDEPALTAAEKILAKTVGARKVFTTALSQDKLVASARIRTGFLDEMANVSHAGARPSASDLAFRQGYRKIAKSIGVLGADLGDGWKPAFDLLTQFAGEVKKYRMELERLAGAIEREQLPGKVEELQRAYQATRRGWLHRRLKGLLGELFVANWDGWRLIRQGYEEMAERLAAKLGPGWEAVTVSGHMYLGGLQVWDEAILLVRRGGNPPEAKLFLAMQVKVAQVATALDQTLNDTIRELAARDLRVVLPDAGERWFRLTPLPPDMSSYRWVANAGGGEIPTKDVLRLFEERTAVHQYTLPVSFDEFEEITDRLLKIAAERL